MRPPLFAKIARRGNCQKAHIVIESDCIHVLAQRLAKPATRIESVLRSLVRGRTRRPPAPNRIARGTETFQEARSRRSTICYAWAEEDAHAGHFPVRAWRDSELSRTLLGRLSETALLRATSMMPGGQPELVHW